MAMIFSISSGSEGTGSERYSVYLPFVIQPGTPIGELENIKHNIKVSEYRLTLERLNNYYVLILGDFDTYEEANCFMQESRASLLWFSLKFRCGVKPEDPTGKSIQYYDPPIAINHKNEFVSHIASSRGWTEIDGNYNADDAIVRPEHLRLTRSETGKPNVIAGISLEQFTSAISEALSFPNIGHIISNQKLVLSLEIYASHKFELSSGAKLLRLISSLEAISPNIEISGVSLSVLDRLRKVIKYHQDKNTDKLQEREDLERLLSRLADLKKEGYTESIRRLATSIAECCPNIGDSNKNKENLTTAYKVRSVLLHEGKANEEELKTSLEFLQEFVPTLLKVRFINEASQAKI